jgi:hypothetical protein
VLEVGPGTGALTEELLARGCEVVASELDRGLAQLLRERFAPEAGAGRFTASPGSSNPFGVDTGAFVPKWTSVPVSEWTTSGTWAASVVAASGRTRQHVGM